MNFNEFGQYIVEQWHYMGYFEIIAVIFAVMEVLFAYKNSVLLYPCGIISTLIFIWLFIRPEVGLYADASLNFYYFIISIYGWYLWRKKDKKKLKLHISFWTKKERITTLILFASAFVLIYFILRYWTPSTVPIGDAFISASAWAGMWLLAKRKAENWIVLNVSNAVAIPLLFYKNMPLTALLTLFLFIVAIFGYFKWRNQALSRKGLS